MIVNILAVGDITGPVGLDILSEKLRTVKKTYDIAFTVVNGENAAGLGLKKEHAETIFNAGADVITLGNHTWSKREIIPVLDENKNILRPANFAPQNPGRGWGLYETSFGTVCVINLIGRAEMDHGNENPFFEADKILKQSDAKVVLVDFHTETTSEKHAMAYYLDGRVSAVWGTHTHVQTSDGRVFANGTGYITDLGMTGPIDSIIGMKPEQPILRYLGNPPVKYESALGPAKIEGAVFKIDSDTGKCTSVETIRVM